MRSTEKYPYEPASGWLLPKLVIAMGRTYDQMPRRHDACGAGFQIGGCARLPLRECVPAWTKAVPSALFDRYRESVPAGCPGPYLYDRLTSGSDDRVGFGREA